MTIKMTLFALLAAFSMFGCGSTAEGVKKDAAENGQKSAEAAKNLETGAKEAGKDMGAATMLTPKVKTAIDADKRLNDPTNLINVNSTSEEVTLEGHVTTEELKSLAAEIATKTMKDEKATQKLNNKLVVKA